MSQYSWAEAKLTFKDNETLEMAVLPLRKGGWLQDNNQMLHDEGNDFAGEGIVCIEGNTLTLPSEQYLNLGRCIDEVIDMADSGFYYSNSDDGDLWISGWKNSEWQVAGDYKEIAKYLDDDKQKDYFLLDEDEFGEKYKTDDYWGERTDFFTEATENFIKRAW
jgi:hypothetical protein